MYEFRHLLRLRCRSMGRQISVLLTLALLGACGASEGSGSGRPAISSGEAGADDEARAASPAPADASGAGSTSGSVPGAVAGDSQERLPPPGEGWVIFGSDTVRVELARTPAEREQGLMYREELPEGRGMLFIFQDAQHRSFWMQNTFVPLDIAYLDESLRIVDIQAMDPETEDGHPSAQPAMFALEVPQGWFAAQGIRVGDEARLVLGPGS